MLAASDRLTAFLRRATANGRRPAWALKLDVASFFCSIDKQRLYDIIARRVRTPELRWLTRTILFHDPTVDYRFRAGPGHTPPPASGRYPIPAQKSLFGKHNERGLPIGNLTSQFWANVYLNELDQFVKRTLKCRYYVRYVDDLVLLHDDPGGLRGWRREIEAFLARRLGLRLREPAVEPQRVRGGIDFVGWTTFWTHRRPRRRTLATCEGRLRQFERRVLRPMWAGAALRLDVEREPASLPRLRATLASYSGHLRHGAAWRDWVALWRRHGWLEAVFVPAERDPWRVQARWPVGAIGGPRFSIQYGRLLRHVGDRALLFCQVGRFVEFYGPQRQPAARILRLVRVRIARGGHAFSVGFPLRLSPAYVSRAVRAGYVVAEVREAGRVEPRCAERRLVGLWCPGKSSSEARTRARWKPQGSHRGAWAWAPA